MKENQQSANGNAMDSVLQELKQLAAFLGESEDGAGMLDAVHDPLETLQKQSEEQGFSELARAAAALQRYLQEELGSSPSVDGVMAFSFALGTLVETLEAGGAENAAADFKAADVLGILGVEEEAGADAEAQAAEAGQQPSSEPPQLEQQAAAPELTFSKLEAIVSNLGGKLQLAENGNAQPTFHIIFPATNEYLRQVETAFSPLDTQADFATLLSENDTRFPGLLDSIRDFMHALAEGNMARCQEILSAIAEQQQQAGLYQEIGTMARDLHDSLTGFMTTLDPTLREMVEDKIPDSGNRLEHILKLTDNAANTTLDNVEQMQTINQQDQEHLKQLDALFQELQAVGEPAQQRMDNARQVLQELKDSAGKIHDRLITITTAQDYQDLTGQIIMKIISLLAELERKLVEIIKTFGVKVDAAQGKAKQKDELYGPAHEHMTDALSSQDDVDALLAEFGF